MNREPACPEPAKAAPVWPETGLSRKPVPAWCRMGRAAEEERELIRRPGCQPVLVGREFQRRAELEFQTEPEGHSHRRAECLRRGESREQGPE
jgi:hypothetical protein